MTELIELGREALPAMVDPAAAGETAWYLARGYQMAPGQAKAGTGVIDEFLDRVDPGTPWRSRSRPSGPCSRPSAVRSTRRHPGTRSRPAA